MNHTSQTDQLFPRDPIVSSDRIMPEYRQKIEAEIQDAPDPVAYLVSREYVKMDDWYPHLAQLYDLPYYEDLPLVLDPGQAAIQSIPLTLLIQHTVYVWEEHDTLMIAIANPCISRSAIDEIQAYTSNTKTKIVIAHPNVIKDSLLHSYQKTQEVVSEDYVGVFHPDSSAKRFLRAFAFSWKWIIVMSFIVLIGFFSSWYSLMAVLFFGLNGIYFVVNAVKFYTFFRAFFSHKLVDIDQPAIASCAYQQLPIYTILVPLKNEAHIVPQILSSLEALDYPKDKLDVKFAVEFDDEETRSALNLYKIGQKTNDASPYDYWTQITPVPKGVLSTKPRSCNFAFTFGRGSYTVIYDAEDKPDADQLKKAYLGFMQSPLNTICLQAKLNFYNSRKNWMTRFFSLEYGFWFEYFLSGLGEIHSPIPLGGTSNHFVSSMLKRIGSWDPYNVTEDADLGLRIAKKYFRTGVLHSYTMEEANSEIINWIHQRTRWQKGFLITFLVHASKPVRSIEKFGLYGYFMTYIAFGVNFFLPFINPILWFLLAFSFMPQFELEFPLLVWLIGFFNLIIGNSVYLILHLISALKNKRYDLAPFAILMPVYWVLISVATVRAAWQFLFNPYKWEKTKHGLR